MCSQQGKGPCRDCWGPCGCPDESGFPQLRRFTDTSLLWSFVPMGQWDLASEMAGLGRGKGRGGCRAHGVKGNSVERVGGRWSDC